MPNPGVREGFTQNAIGTLDVCVLFSVAPPPTGVRHDAVVPCVGPVAESPVQIPLPDNAAAMLEKSTRTSSQRVQEHM